MCSDTGDVYEGEWQHSLEHGCGTYKTSRGELYEGQWAYGLMHGVGTFHDSNGVTYEGEWDGGLRHGKGNYKGPKNAKILPEGWLVCQNKRVIKSKTELMMITKKNEHLEKIQRLDEDDKYERNLYYFNLKAGCAVWHHPYYYEYEGEWKDNRPDGEGVAKWPDGRIYQGQWKAGFMHGEGSEFEANGDSYVGDWKYGVRDGNGTFTELKYGIYEGGFRNNVKQGFGIFRPYGAPVEEGYYRDGKRNELPENWTEHIAKNKQKYYYNSVTKESTWTKPAMDASILTQVRRLSMASIATPLAIAQAAKGAEALQQERARVAAKQ